ncbi:MAG TPA: hypothetical protein VFX95_07365 [Caulobacteraceae bacterium]|nr:hypothetical protein [Caulobacteraceae bacterium]
MTPAAIRGRLAATAAAAAIAVPAAAGEPAGVNMTVAQAWSGVAPCLANAARLGRSRAATLERVTASSRRIDARVAGYTFVGEAEPLVAAFRQMTRRAPRSIRPGKNSYCRDVECAARTLFGAEVGSRLLLLAAVYHYNASPLGTEATQPWTVAELDELLDAFGDLPPSLFPLEPAGYRALVYRHRSHHARAPGSPFEPAASAGEGSEGIVVVQGWRKVGKAERRAIIAHELAHEFTRSLPRSSNWRARWARAMAADAQAAAGAGRVSFASVYAQRNLDEDFAESFVAYRYMAPLLKRRAPGRYALLRDWVFKGVEYGSAAQCADRA